MIRRLEAPGAAAPLFGDWPEAIVWSCLQNVMGEVWGDDSAAPRSAAAVLGDFCFFAGAPSRELALSRDLGRPFSILVPRTDAWAELLSAVFGRRAEPVTRYATRKEADVFDRDRLLAAVRSLPPGDSLAPIDRALYDRCLAQAWSRDLVGQFPDCASFQALGLGFVVLRRGRVAAGASSYAVYRGGIEIEIDTRRDCRRQGLAYACGARLILECLDRGLYPSWDAHTPDSLRLAERLGYHPDRPYRAFVLHPTL